MTQKKKELPYLERDISWMYFNRRILQEAARPHVPLLERMAFWEFIRTTWMNFQGTNGNSEPYCRMYG